ncbi:MAG TPA: hypothetical protein VFX15_05435 [Actinomycetes bacterium]|nr:hypothetical protein [Actinomycetes bacterium]
MNDATTTSDADGVLVASAWRSAAGDVLVRITVSGPGGEGDTVCTVSSTTEALACMEEWLSQLGA